MDLGTFWLSSSFTRNSSLEGPRVDVSFGIPPPCSWHGSFLLQLPQRTLLVVADTGPIGEMGDPTSLAERLALLASCFGSHKSRTRHGGPGTSALVAPYAAVWDSCHPWPVS